VNILTFDIEDWYNCDFLDTDLNWSRHEVRIYGMVDSILEELSNRNIKASFFCLGWLADHHPNIIAKIKGLGHHIGCHSYQHQLSSSFSKANFKIDTDKAKKKLEDITGDVVDAFRAPGFSITRNNLDYLQILIELGFTYDASLLPGHHDYGGFPELEFHTPFLIETGSGYLKEFPMSTFRFFNKGFIYSGGGFFRLLPYFVIKRLSRRAKYLMTYFHPRDFDVEQPVVESLSVTRKFKSYYGLKGSFLKFQYYLSDFDFLSIEQASRNVNWSTVPRLKI
jgi:polysaccharide deacetylase family protein (PEP-CTERM system associated)